MSLSITGKGHTIWEAAKQEWTKHICNLLVPIIEEGFRNIYTNCEKRVQQDYAAAHDEEAAAEGGEDKNGGAPLMGVITMFKQTLLNIPKWNQEILEQEYDRVLKSLAQEDGGDEVLDDLVKAAFTSHILILSSVNLSGQADKKVEMHIPSSKRFVHKIYIEAARVFYRNPHLFVTYYHDAESEYRFHKNGAKIEQVLCNSVEEAIRKLMPLRTILRAYMTASNDGAASVDAGVMQEVEDITRRVSPRSKRGLRNILRSYIQTTAEVMHRDDDDDNDRDEEEDKKTNPETDEVYSDAVIEKDKNQMVIESVPKGNERRESLLARRTSPERSPRPRYRSPPLDKMRHRERSSRDSKEESKRYGHRRDEEENGNNDNGFKRSRRSNDDGRRRRRDDGKHYRRRRRRDDDDYEHQRRRRRDDDDGGDDSDNDAAHEDEKGKRQNKEADDYAFDLLTISNTEKNGRSTSSSSSHRHRREESPDDDDASASSGSYQDDEPTMKIAKKPSRSRRHRPNSIEFRLQRDDDNDDDVMTGRKKAVTYKAPKYRGASSRDDDDYDSE